MDNRRHCRSIVFSLYWPFRDMILHGNYCATRVSESSKREKQRHWIDFNDFFQWIRRIKIELSRFSQSHAEYFGFSFEKLPESHASISEFDPFIGAVSSARLTYLSSLQATTYVKQDCFAMLAELWRCVVAASTNRFLSAIFQELISRSQNLCVRTISAMVPLWTDEVKQVGRIAVGYRLVIGDS